MKKRALLILGIATTGLSLGSMAGVDFLVSKEEMDISNGHRVTLMAKSAPVKDAPTIEVLSPNIANPVPSPTSIQVKFGSSPPSAVKPETLRVLYGFLEIDITKRLMAKAKIDGQGLVINEAALPKGHHYLLMSIEDSNGRVANQPIEFEVK